MFKTFSLLCRAAELPMRLVLGALVIGQYPGFASAATVATGSRHSCAVVHGGLQCWGDNTYGQLGDGTATSSLSPVPVHGLENGVSAVAAGALHTCALVGGEVQCWGSGFSPEPQTINGLPSDVAEIAAGGSHTCAIAAGGVWCWGQNWYGQLGDGTTDSSALPKAVVGLSGPATKIAAGSVHTCAALDGASAEVWCWGYNGEGQLGDGSTHSSLVPVNAINSAAQIESIAAGFSHSCAVVDGAAWCWGNGDDGQLGAGSSASSTTPVLVPNLGAGVLKIATGIYHTCAQVNDEVFCWGGNTEGQLGDGSTNPSLTPVQVITDQALHLTGVSDIAATGDHACAINDAIRCWGSDEYGELGNAGSRVIVRMPTVSPLGGLNGVSAGFGHACGTLYGGAYCWGWNQDGQLGINSRIDTPSTAEVFGLGFAHAVSKVSAGWRHSCAVVNGSVQCWGYGGAGQLGDGGHADSLVPREVNGLASTVADISVGALHTCAAESSGNVQCWGRNISGELGDGTLNWSSVPVTVMVGSTIPVPLTGASAVATGSDFSCAITDNGVRCWGWNWYGQLGNGTFDDSKVAMAVSGLSGSVVAINAGLSHVCAVVSDGTSGSLWCWGDNNSYQLGVELSGMSTSPVPIHVSSLTGDVTAVATGWHHTCAVVDGGVKCWGFGGTNALDDGTTTISSSPVDVLPAGTGITAVTAGDRFTCATGGTTTWCWGSGLYGRLGDGSLGYSSLPVTVLDTIFRNKFDE